MRLLIINFVMDDADSVLAWQADVARRLAQRCERVFVLTHRAGQYESVGNMQVESFVPRPWGVPARVGGQWFYNLNILQLCRQQGINACFVHMAHEWAVRLSPAFWLKRVPVMLWYAHGSVTRSLHRALHCVDRVVTSTVDGFRIPSPKVRVIGQGINLERFSPPRFADSRNTILYVGRVSRRKRITLLIDVMHELKSRFDQRELRLQIVGPTLTDDDRDYCQEICRQIRQYGLQDDVDLVGPVHQSQIPGLYRDAFLHLNVSQTGSLDKTILESLACGCPVISSNEACFEVLQEYPECIVRDDRPESIARQVLDVQQNAARYDTTSLRHLLVGRHDIDSYVQKLHHELQELT